MIVYRITTVLALVQLFRLHAPGLRSGSITGAGQSTPEDFMHSGDGFDMHRHSLNLLWPVRGRPCSLVQSARFSRSVHLPTDVSVCPRCVAGLELELHAVRFRKLGSMWHINVLDLIRGSPSMNC